MRVIIGFTQLGQKSLLAKWCRENSIPLVFCDVSLGTTMEPMAHFYHGTKKATDLYSAYRTKGGTPIRLDRAALIREEDYLIIKVYWGKMVRGWYQFLNRDALGEHIRYN